MERHMWVVRRFLLIIAAAWALSGPAMAAEFRPFDQAAFEAAQAEGRPIFIAVAANWCPTCRAQTPIIRATAADPAFENMVIFRLVYDRQRPAWRALRVTRQSTLIAFRGRQETGRLVAATDPARIEQLMRSATQQ